MNLSNEKLLILLKNKNFKYIENIITSKNYDNSTFEKFYSELVDIEEYSTLEYFYDNFSNQIYDKYFYLSVYNLCADSTQLPLIKKLSKDKEFIKNENADHYVLRAHESLPPKTGVSRSYMVKVNQMKIYLHSCFNLLCLSMFATK